MDISKSSSFLTNNIFKEKVSKKLSTILSPEQASSFENSHLLHSYFLLINLDRFSYIEEAYGEEDSQKILNVFFEDVKKLFASEMFKDNSYVSVFDHNTIGVFLFDLSFDNLKSFENFKNNINKEIYKINQEVFETNKQTRFKNLPTITCSIELSVIDNTVPNKKYEDLFKVTNETLYTANFLFRDRVEFTFFP